MNQNQRYSNNNRHYHGKTKHQPRPRKRRQYTPPEPAKPCRVRYLPEDTLLFYDKVKKNLENEPFGFFTDFPSKRKAQVAIWHTVKKSGQPGSHVDYRIEEV